MKKESGGDIDPLEGGTEINCLEQAASYLLGPQSDDGRHSVLPADPARHRALLDSELFGGGVLGLEVGDEVIEDGHVQAPNRNTCILGQRNTCLQDYRDTFDNERMEFMHRVIAARTYAGLTQAELAERLDIKQGSVSDWETGKSKSSKHTTSIAHICGVNALWLEKGVGDMVPQERNQASDTGEVALQNLRLHEASLVPVSDTAMVPVVSWVIAGSWGEAVDLFAPGDAEVWMPCPERISDNGFALRVEGDSMTSPYPGKESYPHGTIIYVDPNVAYASGDPVIAKLPDSNEATFKILVEDAGRAYLKPINPQYPMIPVDQETHIVGVVIGSFQSRRR